MGEVGSSPLLFCGEAVTKELAQQLIGKVAVVTADPTNDVTFVIRGEQGDCTSFLSWVGIWQGKHYSFEAVRQDSKKMSEVLSEYKVVIFSGHPQYFAEIIEMARSLRGKAVTAFLPEGDVSQYDLQGINSFQPMAYEAWNECDVFMSMEEDKLEYYRSLTSARVEFVHVPLDPRMEVGEFWVPREEKSKHVVVYGDNNPNGPITVFGVMRTVGWPIRTVCIEEGKLGSLVRLFGVDIVSPIWKVPQFEYLRVLGKSFVHLYPTRWIGSAREVISCAVVGTPCIGTYWSHTQRRLFPGLSVNPWDVVQMRLMIQRLVDDKEFYNTVVEYAWSQVGFYSMELTISRFLQALFPGEVNKGE